MIKITNINKYFNKGKQNEIHVINNTSLKFENKGLVSILGASGSGKTTLLNVIGGLDKATGSIKFDDITINKYDSKVLDNIRNEKIGYVFQNYHLMENITVFDNVKLSLSMIGITNNEEIDFKVNYVLEAVGMVRYKNKLASDLSGGQKQRVAIARALVKDPEVIIADEPTGNLDTKNSVEVLKIIKEISKEKLVILVTHNENLANNFSDRIIKIKDGSVIEDNLNHSITNDLDYTDENIYLKDLNKAETNNIKIYSDSNIDDLNLTIVKIHNNYYLKSNDNNITIENINSSNKRLLNMKKEDVIDSDIDKISYDPKLLKKDIKDNKAGIYTMKDALIMAMRKLTNLGRKAKVQIIALIMLSIMFTISILFLFSTLFVDESKITINQNLYSIEDNFNMNDLDKVDDLFIYRRTSSPQITSGRFSNWLDINLYPVSLLNKDIELDLYEAIIDESVLDKSYEYNYIFSSYSILTKEHLINQKFRLGSEYGQFDLKEIEIKDTVNNNEKAIYISDNLIKEMSIRQLLMNKYNIQAGFKEANNLEITKEFSESELNNHEGKIGFYISDNFSNESLEDLNNQNRFLIENGYYIKGFFKDNSNNQPTKIYFDIINYKQIIINTYNDKANNYFDNNIYLFNINKEKVDINKTYNLYESNYNMLKEQQKTATISNLSQTAFTISLSVLIFFFLVRSSLSNRRKEISVYRALGLRKNEVRKLFIYEYAILTTATSLIGVLIGSYLANAIGKSVLGEFFTIRSNPFFVLIIILLTYTLNILISLIPVNGMLRKTPAEMLTNYDI